MRVFGIFLNVAASLLLVHCGWLLTFRTTTVANRSHSQYRCDFFLKPWYLMLLRCAGVLIWLLTALADYALLTY